MLIFLSCVFVCVCVCVKVCMYECMYMCVCLSAFVDSLSMKIRIAFHCDE